MYITDKQSKESQSTELLVVLSLNPDRVRNVLKEHCQDAVALDMVMDLNEQGKVDCACYGYELPSLRPALKKVTRSLISEAMRRSGGHQTEAAGYLGITQQALSLRLKQYPEIAKACRNLREA